MCIINVLFVNGVRDDGKVNVLKITEKLLYDCGGSCNVYNNINDDLFKKYIITLDSSNETKFSMKNIDVVFNQISEADSHTKTLRKVAMIIDHYKISCINHPLFILNTSRDKIYEKLKKINGLIVPKTIKIFSKSTQKIIDNIKLSRMRYPVILREAGCHGGNNTYLANNKKEIEEIHALALDGRAYYLSEYYCYKDKNNLFSKIRLAIVNGEAYIRHCIFSEKWMIHSGSRENKYKEREKKILEIFDSKIKPRISRIINDIDCKIQLDYYGIDCNIDDDMNVILFELNANMNILLESKNYTDFYTKKINNAVKDMISKSCIE